jgi:hypothetical protein
MPYTVAVGAELSKLTKYCRTPKNLTKSLLDLRDPTINLPQCLKNAGAQPPIVKHFAVHWLGYDPTSMTPQDPFDPANPNNTGWWTAWYGQAEDVLRKTMIRAFEVALGLDAGDGVDTASRCWPITFTWTCGSPMLQGWVHWWDFSYDDTAPAADGIVNVIFSTPGTGQPLYATPRSPGGGATAEDYEENPAGATGQYGLWVIGEGDMDVRQPGSPAFKNVGNASIPAPWPNFFHTKGGTVAVSPAEIDGGMKHAGSVFP